MTGHARKTSNNDVEADFTPDEITCLRMAARGLCLSEIGESLGTEAEDVNLLFAAIEKKLCARNRMHAISVAISQGLIGIEKN